MYRSVFLLQISPVPNDHVFCLRSVPSQMIMFSVSDQSRPKRSCFLSQISPVLNSAFGRESDGGKWTVDFLLQKITSNVAAWSSETSVMTDTLMLFVTMVDNKAR